MRRGVIVFVVMAITVLVPAAASAANGPAYFYRAVGGRYIAPLHPDGLTIYKSSPAYVVLRVNTQVLVLEHYAASNTFPTVAIRNGSATECFQNAKLIILPFFISDFTEGRFEYHGLFLTYTGHFRLDTTNVSRCTFRRAPGPVLPTLSFTKSSAQLQVTCLIRFCNGKLAVFTPAGACQRPFQLLPGVRGCAPGYRGSFKSPGGLTVRLTVPLRGVNPRRARIVLVVGHTTLSSRLLALRRTPKSPARPKPSAISIGCSGATAGLSSTAASGTLTPAGRGPVAVTFTGPSGSTPANVVVVADARGRWTAAFTPAMAGAWSAQATFLGDRTRKSAVSSTCHFTVALQPTQLTIVCPAHAGPSQNATISGTASGPGLRVTLQYRLPTNPTPVTDSVMTDAAGAFSDTVSVGSNDVGTWSVQATFAGSVTRAPASASCTFPVS